MKKSHLVLVFIFLLLIPYICSLLIIGIGYNALVLHASELFRTFAGAICGAFIMFAIKATIQRPLDLVALKADNQFFKQFLRFFSIRRRPVFLFLNIVLDFCLCFLSTYLVRNLFTLDEIVGSTIGYILLIMFVSTCLGSYIEYDNLSIH
ncbi:MAG: hypothetical protein Q3960_00460 [Lactobacillus sp.]|nr:hypothetical protein [Lactobacillus sp.]